MQLGPAPPAGSTQPPTAIGCPLGISPLQTKKKGCPTSHLPSPARGVATGLPWE